MLCKQIFQSESELGKYFFFSVDYQIVVTMERKIKKKLLQSRLQDNEQRKEIEEKQ